MSFLFMLIKVPIKSNNSIQNPEHSEWVAVAGALIIEARDFSPV